MLLCWIVSYKNIHGVFHSLPSSKSIQRNYPPPTHFRVQYHQLALLLVTGAGTKLVLKLLLVSNIKVMPQLRAWKGEGCDNGQQNIASYLNDKLIVMWVPTCDRCHVCFKCLVCSYAIVICCNWRLMHVCVKRLVCYYVTVIVICCNWWLATNACLCQMFDVLLCNCDCHLLQLVTGNQCMFVSNVWCVIM